MNRRRADRIKKRVSCELRHGDRQHSGIVLDVSASGLFVQTNAKARPGAEVALLLSVPGQQESIEVTARVARTKLVPPQLLNVARGGLGLHIEDPSPAYLEFVERVANPPPIEPVAIRPAKASAPGRKKKPVPDRARERLEALRERSARLKRRPPPARGSGARFRVRLRQPATSATRTFVVACDSEAQARERVADEMGEAWTIERVERV